MAALISILGKEMLPRRPPFTNLETRNQLILAKSISEPRITSLNQTTDARGAIMAYRERIGHKARASISH